MHVMLSPLLLLRVEVVADVVAADITVNVIVDYVMYDVDDYSVTRVELML